MRRSDLPSRGQIEVRPIELPRDAGRFVRAWFRIHAGDPHWVPPLVFERKRFLDPRRNRYFRHADVQCFLATRGGVPVGTISAQVDHHHQRVHPGLGHFGFFEFVDDLAVARALVEAATDWLRARGLREVQGPYSFSPNHEFGLLLDDGERDPSIQNPYAPAYYRRIYEALGLAREKSWYAYWLDAGPAPRTLRRISERLAAAHPELTFRPLDMRHFRRDVRLFWEIYEDAWQANWGFAPIPEDEFQELAAGLKSVIDPGLTWYAFVDGEPAAASIALPDLNPLVKRMKGSLLPFGWLTWTFGRGRVDSLRAYLLGVKTGFQHLPLGPPLYLRTWEEALRRKLRGAEASLVVEDNFRMRGAIEKLGGRVRQTYGIYEMDLGVEAARSEGPRLVTRSLV